MTIDLPPRPEIPVYQSPLSIAVKKLEDAADRVNDLPGDVVARDELVRCARVVAAEFRIIRRFIHNTLL